MPTEYVVDASALAKLFLDEPGAQALRTWWYAALAKDTAMSAPTLVRYEVGNLVKRNLAHLSAAQVRRAWREALAGVQTDDGALASAFDIPGLTFYDAAYVALALKRKATLLTYDDRMAKAARSRKVKTARPGP